MKVYESALEDYMIPIYITPSLRLYLPKLKSIQAQEIDTT